MTQLHDIQTGVRLFGTIHLLVIGLSHMVQPRLWTEFFLLLQRQGRVGVFINGFLSLWFGSIIVALHNVWSGIPALLTLLGWAQVVKGTVAFVLPAVGARSLGMVRADRAGMFRVPGAVLTGMGLLLGYDLLR
jgi:hypothetical protein